MHKTATFCQKQLEIYIFVMYNCTYILKLEILMSELVHSDINFSSYDHFLKAPNS